MLASRWATLAVAASLGCAMTLGAACGSAVPPKATGADGGDDGGAASPDASDDATALPPDDGSIPLFGDVNIGPMTDAGCVPVTACPPGAQCGRYLDPCSGQSFACGTPCPSGEICVATNGNPATQACQPKTCAGKCGVVSVDSCGVAASCGGCDAGFDCIDHACVAQGTVTVEAGASDACAPLTCSPSATTQLCGTVHDACGHSISCSCSNGEQCVSGVCTATPPECDGDAGAHCGSVANACGSGSVSCGGCSGANKCVAGSCAPCAAPVCGASMTCGTVNNGCGPAVNCGSCDTSEACYNNGCCTPMTCAVALEGGLVTGCGPVNLGCGVTKACETCPTGQTCVNNACEACVPRTCADFGNAGCGHSDGCGKTLNCCGSGTTSCQGTICCAPGEVNYNGSCCLPGCDLDQPAGPQVSCGQVIYCNGGSGSSSGGAQ